MCRRAELHPSLQSRRFAAIRPWVLKATADLREFLSFASSLQGVVVRASPGPMLPGTASPWPVDFLLGSEPLILPSIAVGYCDPRGQAGVSDKQSNIGFKGLATTVVGQSLQ